MSTAELHELLDSLVEAVARRAPELVRDLRPGVDEDAIERARSVLAPWGLPEEIADLYRWHDGGDGPEFGGSGLFLNWQMRPLEVALDRWQFVQGTQPACWLEVFADHGRPFVDLSAGHGVGHGHGPLVWFGEPESGSVSPVAATLAELALQCRIAINTHEVTFDGWRFDRTPAEIDATTGSDVAAIAIESPSPQWPAAWRRSSGLTEDDEVPPMVTTTVAALTRSLLDAGPVVVSGHCVWDRPFADDGRGYLEDRTGAIYLRIPVHAFVYADPLGRDGTVELAGPDEEPGTWTVRRLYVG